MIKKIYIKIIYFVIFLLISVFSYSTEENNRAVLINKSEIFVDKTGKVNFNEIRSKKFFDSFQIKNDGGFNFGISKNNNWIRFKFSDFTKMNSKELEKSKLYFNFTFFGNLKIFFPIKKEEKKIKYKILKFNLFNNNYGNSEYFTFPIFKISENIDPNSYVYIKASSPYNVSFQILFDKSKNIERYKLKVLLTLGLILGILVAMLLYNGVLYLILSDKTYLSYLAYIFFLTIYQFCFTGIVRLIYPSLNKYFINNLIIIADLSLIFYLYFVWNFLNIPKALKVLKKFYYIIWILFLITITLSLLGYPKLSNQLSYTTLGLNSILIISSVILSIIKKQWVSKFYIFAIIASMFYLSIYTLRGIGVIKYSSYMSYVLFAGMNLEAIFSSFALADRIKKLQQDNLILTKKENELFINKQIAENSNRAKSEFLANMSHEIRTPLNGVIGFNDLLSKTPLNTVQLQYIKNINSSAKTLLGLINNVLDFSKIEANKLELEILKTNIIELIENSVDTIKYQAEKKNLEIILNINPNVPKYAIVDPLRLNQIFINLLGNAVKFTDKGVIEITLKFSKIDDKKGLFYFSVEDSGIGIKKSHQSRLFKLFSQGDNSITRRFGGSGLGLIISNMLANKMGTSIKLESTEGLGSKFYFSLETEYQLGEKIDFSDKIKRVLIITKSNKRNSLIQEKFKYWGIPADAKHSGNDAINLLKENKEYNLLIFDHDTNSFEVIRIIREELRIGDHSLNIIFLSNSKEISEVYNFSKIYDIAFILNKPLKSLELIQCLKNIVQKSDEKNIEFEDEKLVPLSGKFNILIADDFEMNIIYIKEILSRYIPNAFVTDANNGMEAFQYFQEKNFDLIFLDIQMPILDGIQSCKKIREYEKENELKRTSIIALTADALKDRNKEAVKVGIDEYLTKPIKISTLYDILKKYL